MPIILRAQTVRSSPAIEPAPTIQATRRMTIERMRVLPRWLLGEAKANHIGNDDAPTGTHDWLDHIDDLVIVKYMNIGYFC